VTQDFITTLESKAITNNVVVQLKNVQVQDIARSTSLFAIIKKIFIFVIMQRDNAFAKFYLGSRSYNCYQWLSLTFASL